MCYMKKVTVRDFRANLSTYLDEVSINNGTVLQVGGEREGSEIIVMSGATLAKFDERHFVNKELAMLYNALGLEYYNVISEGKETSKLPIEVIIILTDLFRMGTNLMGILSQPNAKTNSAKWDITEYILQAKERKPLNFHGQFDFIYPVLTKLLNVDLMQPKIHTLKDFFAHLAKENTHMYSSLIWNLPEDHFGIVYDATKALGHFMYTLIQFQNTVKNNVKLTDTVTEGTVREAFNAVVDWYDTYVANEPKTWVYDGYWKYK